MGRIGKIVPIRKEYSKSSMTMEACLAEKGYTRFPGTTMKIVPAKAPNGSFLTGLDPDALYIKKMSPEAAELERKRVIALRDELQDITGLDLGPRSDYYKKMFDDRLEQSAKATVVRLKDEENIFDQEDPYQAITFAWLRVHPLIASSWQAWERGDYPPTTKFYVADEEVEQEITYKKKQAVNQAVVLLDTMSLENRKKVARLLGKPVKENTSEKFVYNMLDTWIKSTEVKDGKYRGSNPLGVFMNIATMDAKMLTIQDLIAQAVSLDIYREDNDGTIREGGREIYKNSGDMAVDLSKSKNQDKLLALEERVKAKKLAEYA